MASRPALHSAGAQRDRRDAAGLRTAGRPLLRCGPPSPAQRRRLARTRPAAGVGPVRVLAACPLRAVGGSALSDSRSHPCRALAQPAASTSRPVWGGGRQELVEDVVLPPAGDVHVGPGHAVVLETDPLEHALRWLCVSVSACTRGAGKGLRRRGRRPPAPPRSPAPALERAPPASSRRCMTGRPPG